MNVDLSIFIYTISAKKILMGYFIINKTSKNSIIILLAKTHNLFFTNSNIRERPSSTNPSLLKGHETFETEKSVFIQFLRTHFPSSARRDHVEGLTQSWDILISQAREQQRPSFFPCYPSVIYIIINRTNSDLHYYYCSFVGAFFMATIMQPPVANV